MQNRNTRRGFTLIELLVVVLIISILAAVALPQYNKAVKKAHMREVISLMRTVAKAQEMHYLTKGSYTKDTSALDISIPWTGKGYTISLFLLSFSSGHSGYFHAQAPGYVWNMYYDIPSNKIYCAPITSEWCKSVGGTTTHIPFNKNEDAYLVE